MKKQVLALSLLLCFVLSAALTGCAKKDTPDGIWSSATYTEDAALGNGAKTVQVKIEAEGKSVTLTVKTDGETLGEALTKNGLVEGEDGPYGLYVKKVIGIKADYDADQYYWAFYKDGELLPVGIDDEKLTDGAHYEIVRKK